MKNTVYSGNVTYHSAYSSWNTKKHFLSEHYVHSCTSNLSLQFRNTSFDKLAFDRRERVGRIIRPALLKIR